MDKDESEFYPYKQTRCRACYAEVNKAWAQANRDRRRELGRKHEMARRRRNGIGPRTIRSVEERLTAKLVREGDCLIFTGTRNPDGYGLIATPDGARSAHRIAYTLWVGEIPDDTYVLHSCDNPPCCNHEHLFLGTQADNVKDMEAKGRRRNASGSGHGNTSLTEADVREIRHRYATGGVTQKTLADEFGMTQAGINHIIRRRSWRHVE